MKAESVRQRPSLQSETGALLIEPLRRNIVPVYFSEDDQKKLSDRVKQIVTEILKK